MTFVVATYNVLASSYIRPQWYPRTPSILLRPEHRIPAVAEHVLRLGADIVCLQEVEEGMFAALHTRLAHAGYVGEWTRKTGAKPDGCATFARASSAHWIRISPLIYDDASPDQPASGHVAQIVVVTVAHRRLGIANTHLKWDPPNTPQHAQFGYRQVTQLLQQRAVLAPECSGWIVCGDMNSDVNGDAVAALTAAGFQFSHSTYPGAATCNANRHARMIDYLFYDAALQADPLPLPEVRDDTPLPGPEEPSDHVAIAAIFEWRAASA